MAIEIKRDMPVRDLVEFTFVAVPVDGQDNTYDLNAELRIGKAEVDESAISEAFTVKLQRVYIELDYSGADIAPGSKFGEPTKPNESVAKRTLKRQTEVAAKGGFDAKAATNAVQAPSVKASVSADASAQKTFSSTDVSEQDVVTMRVKAIGNDRWEIAEVDGEPLDGKIMNNERLCQIKQADRSNAILVGGRILAKQKDFRFSTERRFMGRLTQNDSKLLGVFLTKQLAKGKYSGEINLAELEIEI